MKSKVSHSIKLERMQQQILEYLGRLIHEEVKDPRVSRLTSIVRVDVAHDLKYARVHVSTLGSPKEQQDAIEGLNSAKGFLRSRLSRIMQTKIAPEIVFVSDTSMEYAAYIQKKLEELNIPKSDAEDEEE
ncbi:MAG: 30S ribosome-binding factor RbfA [Clostridia bacterium]|nr:30S ribosome-binding factor RbfA [Clostridia bacterium]